jgi:Zn-dependent protease with chaperone function
MRTDWEGAYLDGRTAVRHRVAIRLTQGGLQLRTPDGVTHWWPYAELRRAESFHAGDPIRLERGGEFPEILQVSDPAFLNTLGQLAPEIASGSPDPRRRWRWGPVVLFSALGVILVGALLFLWVIPSLAAFLAPRMPVAWEEALGNEILPDLAPEERRCEDAAGAAGMRTLLETLTGTLPEPTYHFRVFVTDHEAVNAFAAPGGVIVVYRGLLERVETPEAVAGVLAHEIQHVMLRHGTRVLLAQASTGVLLAAVTGGNAGEGMRFGLEGARVLSLLRYSRENEAEADAGGLRMLLEARVDPSGLIAFLSALEKEEKGMPEIFSYLSTHPETGDRIAALRRASRRHRGGFVTPLDAHTWRDVKNICSSTGGKGDG